ncbi:hypothetical protein NDA16_002406 [Ustilago loliicola]|nr:hypothetical protein NDA16_002406 [Ustilago loliicola]
MVPISPSNSLYLIFLLLSVLTFGSLAIGNDPESLASSSSSSQPKVLKLEASPMDPDQTKMWTHALNTRFKDWHLDPSPYVMPETPSEEFIRDSLHAVYGELLSQRGQKGLLYLGMTPDNKRMVRAMFLQEPRWRGLNAAIVSTPKVWKSLDENMQLHTLAYVQKHDKDRFKSGWNGDFSVSELDALTRRIVPKTPQSEFDDLLTRFPGPGFHLLHRRSSAT